MAASSLRCYSGECYQQRNGVSVKMRPDRRIKAQLAQIGSDTSNPGLSVSRQVTKKLVTTYGYLRARWDARGYLPKAIAEMSQAEGSFSNRQALVMASGPSLHHLDVEAVSRAQRSGMHIYAVNSFLLTDLASRIVPSHYVLSDPGFGPSSRLDWVQRVWARLDASPEINLIVPHFWFSDLHKRDPRPLFFNDCGLHGWSGSTSPLKARRYISLTAYKALAVAVFMGYEKVYIIGFDNSVHRHVQVDEHGRILLGGQSHYFNAQGSQDLSDQFPQGFADCLFRESLAILDMERYFDSHPVVNLDPNSSIRCFKKDSSDLVRV